MPRSKRTGLGLTLYDLLRDNIGVLVSETLNIMSEIYTKKDDFLYQPIVYRQFLNKVGTTSIQYASEIYSRNGTNFNHNYTNIQ